MTFKCKGREKEYLHEYYLANQDKRKEYSREYSKINKDKIKKNKRRYYLENTVRALLKAAKQRAKRKNLFFDLVEKDVVIPEICPVFKIPLLHQEEVHSDNSPSIDRINNLKGYTKDNICVIAHRANALKSNASIEEFEAIIKYMKNNKEDS